MTQFNQEYPKELVEITNSIWNDKKLDCTVVRH